MSKPIGIATLHEANVRHFLASAPIDGVDPESDSLDDLARNKDVVRAVLREVNAVGKKGGLKGADVLGGLLLDGEEWTVSLACPLLPFPSLSHPFASPGGC